MIDKSMIGQRVRIGWKRPEHDWPYFVVRDVKPKRGLVFLQGADYPDSEGGWTHQGDCFWAAFTEIFCCEVAA